MPDNICSPLWEEAPLLPCRAQRSKPTGVRRASPVSLSVSRQCPPSMAPFPLWRTMPFAPSATTPTTSSDGSLPLPISPNTSFALVVRVPTIWPMVEYRSMSPMTGGRCLPRAKLTRAVWPIALFSLSLHAHNRPDGEMVDTRDLKSLDHCGRAGSSPAPGTRSPMTFSHRGACFFRDPHRLTPYFSAVHYSFLVQYGQKTQMRSFFSRCFVPKFVTLYTA